MIFAGIMAAGIGSRVKSIQVPKQFADLCGKPLIIRVLEVFLSVKEIDKIIIAINSDWKDYYIQLINEFSLDINRIDPVSGGNTRFESLVNLVRHAKKTDTDRDSVILTHDCARVFVTKDIIYENIEKIRDYDIITTCIPVVNTLVYCENDNIVSDIPKREKLWDGLTPQTFYIDRFLNILDRLPAEKYGDYNEAGKLFLDFGGKYGIVEGSRNLFKITNDIDLQYGEFLLKNGFVK